MPQTNIARKQLAFGQRLADDLAKAIGSWPFIIFQTVLVISWISLNLMAYVHHWDPYPFILLNLAFSTQSAYAGPIIMMSQNRQAERDRENAIEDFQTNLQAKEEIEALRMALTRLETQKIDQILEYIQETRTEEPQTKKRS